MLQKIWTAIKHNHVLVVSMLACVVLIAWTYGCQITTRNPFEPSEKVTRPELDAEIENYVAKVSLAYKDLAKQEEIRSLIFNSAVAYASGEGVNPVGVITTLASILGIGAVIDNRRKDAVIKSKTNALDALVYRVERDTV